MAEPDKSNLINLASGQEEPYKVCHRSIGQQIVVGTPPAPAGVISRQTPAAIPLSINLGAPCVGPRCRMWDKDQGECLEVVAAGQAMELSNVAEAHGDQIADGFNLLLAEIRAGLLLFTPAIGSTRPKVLPDETPAKVGKKSKG